MMRAHGIVGYRPRRPRSLTKPDAGAAPAPDLLGRLFDLARPDVAWCGDVTWIPTVEGWLYLASVIDPASRHLLGYSMSMHHDADDQLRRSQDPAYVAALEAHQREIDRMLGRVTP